MSVSDTTMRQVHLCDGGTVAFAFSHAFENAADLEVILVTESTGAETTLTLNVDYTVTGGSGSSGTVTTVATYSAAYTLVIRNSPARTQTLDLTGVGTFSEEDIEAALDQIVHMVQELNDQLRRIPKLKKTTATFDLVLPELTSNAGKVLAVNATADGVEWIAN